ncbi:MAG: hypothetical protein LBF37_04155 [Rickettsiales bacterium]|jgi:hypothetical protein|nr:hypothetical protein [Rickettsiales bacterium]
MKKVLLGAAALTALPTTLIANPACAVCTVAIGASLEITRRLGVEDAVVGLWAGALLTLMGYWLIAWFDKKKWNFWGRNFLFIALSVGMVGFMYIDRLTYSPCQIWFFRMDPFLFATILGSLAFIGSHKLYEWMKKKNGGRAHFPFERVVIPLVVLGALSVYFTICPL